MEEKELRFCRRCEEKYEFRKSANPWWNGPKQMEACQKCRTVEESKAIFDDVKRLFNKIGDEDGYIE